MNKEISNTMIEVEEGIELNDKDYISDLLATLKAMVKDYTVALTEVSNEELFSKYQSYDNDIKNELDTLLNKETLTDSQRNEYRDIIKNQYKNLTYTIKDEKIDGNNAIVTAEIEVLDFKKTVDKLDDEYSSKTDVTTNDYIDEKLKRLKDVKEKIKYTLEIEVNKDESGNWKIVNLTDTDIKKIQGMY